MSRWKVMLAIVGCALFLAVPASADKWNKKTTVKLAEPMEIPGRVLEPGTYVFRVVDSLSDRHIVQVTNEKQTMVYATILAIPNYKLKPEAKTVLEFKERAAGRPQALKAWFYPAEDCGQEFVYPKARAIELAEATKEPVLAAEVTPTETPKQLEQAPVVAVTPEKKEVEVAQVVEPKPAPPAAAPAPVPAEPAQELPKTASPLPLLSLLGLASLGVSAAVRSVFNRRG